MKKVLGILAVSAALVGFTACGGDDSTDAQAQAVASLAAQVEAKATEVGATFDAECAIKELATLSSEDIQLLTDNMDSDGNPADYGVSEKGQAAVEKIGNDCLDLSGATADDGSADTTMP
ncbi:MAG: hypothetical protein WCK23_11650 [Actinomycetes bacterium]